MRSKTRFAVEFPSEGIKQGLQLVTTAEKLGFDGVWLTDSQLLFNEVFTLTGYAAAKTRRITLGTCVTNPVTRDVTVLAGASATLGHLSKGRFMLGIGRGDSAVHSAGLIQANEEYLAGAIQTIRALVAGTSVKRGDHDVRMRFPYRVPVYAAGSSPGSLRMAGRVADGVFMHVGAMPQFYEYALQNVMQGAREAGRTMKELKLLSWVICSISENHKKAISAVKYMIVGLLRFAGGMITTLPEDVTGIDSRFMVQLHDELRKIRKIANRETQVEMMNRLIPDMLVEKYAVAGTPKECRAKVEELLDKHPDAILFNVQPPSERVLQSRLISKNIVAQYR